MTKSEAYAKTILKDSMVPKSHENANEINRKINESKWRLISQTANQFEDPIDEDDDMGINQVLEEDEHDPCFAENQNE